jgi:hypothetical protein
MAYATIPGRRFEYDIGGGSAYQGTDIDVITGALTSVQLGYLNGESKQNKVISISPAADPKTRVLWIFLPEKYNVSGLGFLHLIESAPSISVHASPDSTNGLDGTWLAATLPNGDIPCNLDGDDDWRDKIRPCTFSEAVKVIRVAYTATIGGTEQRIDIYALHIYGTKASGEIPDDILFLDDDEIDDPEFIRDLDFGDRPEGTTIQHRIKLKNSSETKTANNLSLGLVDDDFVFSMDEGETWVTSATIATLSPSATTSSIIIKNTIPPPTQLLGPRAPRFTVEIGSWSS